eukprot:8642810-Karenia_brevis.AAC.1
MDRVQSAIIKDLGTVLLVSWLCSNLNPSIRIWPWNPTLLKDCLNRGLHSAGITGSDKLSLKQLGRWSSDNSFNVYLQEAMGLLVWATTDKTVAAWLECDL